MDDDSLRVRAVPGMTFLGLLLLLVLCLPQLAMGNTYPVTSTQCTGPGSIVEAMGLANANPGTDTISIAAGLTIDAGTCPHPPGRFDDVNFVILEARESTVIEGNGATILGHIGWVTLQGINTPLTACPSARRGDWITSLTPGLINVGQKDQDNSAITVTIRNLTLRELDAVANIFRNGSLVVEDSTFFRIISSATSGCQRNAVDARVGANFIARRTRWEEIVNFNQVIANITNPSISGYRAGNLVIEESQFRLMFRAGAVNWWAQPGGTANIVSSVFDASGAMVANGDTLTNIVNTVWAASPIGDPAAQDRFLNAASRPMNFVGSTVLYPDVVYPSYCDTQPNGEDCYGWILRDSRSNAGPINFFGSAIGVNFPDIPGPGKLLEGLPTGAPSGFSADAYTWIQPTPQQPVAALKSITNQPNLLTDAPGLPTASPWIPDWATPLEGTPAAPGLLVDAIDNALCGQVNALRNPVDGSCLTKDAYGNPRVDGNGRRSIGAVQVSLAPTLEVSAVGDQVVDLKWSRPQNPASGAVTGYEIRYCETGTLTCSTSTIAGAATLTASLTGLTNGVSYDFRVVPLIGAVPGAQPSNTVNATPVGLIGTPVVTAVAGDAQVSLSWTTPAGNGHVLGRYTVLWRPVGSATFSGGRIVNAPSTNTVISGLINGTAYEFLVAANSSDGTTGPQGSATATPQAAPTLNYANPSNWPQNTPLILDPSFGQLLGTATYSLPSGTLPTGVGLNPATGIISGTPTVLGETTSATIRLTDGATGLYAETTVALNIVAPSANPQLWYPAIQATVGVGPVGSIPTQFGIPAGAVWSVYPGDSLPGGFTLNPATGVISGTPTTAPGQVVDITIQACWGGCDPNAGEVRLAPMIFWIVPRLQYPAVTVATAGVPETITPTVDPWSGGQFSIASGSLPDGMTLNPATGVISGTPQSGQDHSVTVRYSTGVNVLEPPLEFVYSTARINVDWPAITLTYPGAVAFVGARFSVAPTVTGLTGTAVYSLYSGRLPQGLSLDPATGAITGVPTDTPGNYSVVIEVTGPYGSQRTSFTIRLLPRAPAPAPALSPPALALSVILLMLVAWRATRSSVGNCVGRSA